MVATAVALVLVLVIAVTPASASGSDRRDRLPPRPTAAQSTCAGIRGNGQNLFAHYGALARHVEEYGAVACAAGGSSGSITAFFLESMWANPDVQNCERRRPCGGKARDARLALMLKSVIGLVDTGLFEDVATVGALVQGIADGGIAELLDGPVPQEGIDALVRLLRDLGPLINPEVIELLLTSPDPVFHATDIIEGLQKGLQFIVDDPRVFLRTSVIDFDQFATLVGVYGSFYAGYGPADRAGVSAWLDACAEPGLGKTWEQVAELPGTDGRTCGQTFGDLFNAYREAVATDGGPNRADDPVGRYMPAFGVTGVLSVGGWADPLRVLPLEALGTRKSIAVNRLGGVGGFTESVTRLLNASDADVAALYSTTDPSSSFFKGLDEATGVWCTDWDGQGGDPNLLFNDAYHSPLITADRQLLRPRFGYENVGPDYSIAGCTPGVAVPVP